MKATTHTEVYRPFKGELKTYPMRARTLAWSGIRIGFRRKLPALMLFTIPAILTIVTSFIIQVKFEAEGGSVPGVPNTQAKVMGSLLSQQLGAVEKLVIELLQKMRWFVVLAMGWYGSGLIAEDRRLRANLLYFARPLTRFTYALGKLGTVCFWGFCAVGVPVLALSSVASFASPDWSFLVDRWPVILKMLGYAILWVFVHGLLVLAISSVCDRRNHALAGLFGFYLLTSVGAEAMTRIFDGVGWRLVSIPRNFQRLSESLFDLQSGTVTWSLEASLWAIGLYACASLAVLAIQTRKMEVGN